MPNVTDEQWAQIQSLVNDMGAKKKAADDATKAANDGQANLTGLQAEVAQLQALESQTSADEATSLANLTAFVRSLSPEPTPGPAPQQQTGRQGIPPRLPQGGQQQTRTEDGNEDAQGLPQRSRRP